MKEKIGRAWVNVMSENLEGKDEVRLETSVSQGEEVALVKHFLIRRVKEVSHYP